jgi:hypothetical protein
MKKILSPLFLLETIYRFYFRRSGQENDRLLISISCEPENNQINNVSRPAGILKYPLDRF